MQCSLRRSESRVRLWINRVRLRISNRILHISLRQSLFPTTDLTPRRLERRLRHQCRVLRDLEQSRRKLMAKIDCLRHENAIMSSKIAEGPTTVTVLEIPVNRES